MRIWLSRADFRNCGPRNRRGEKYIAEGLLNARVAHLPPAVVPLPISAARFSRKVFVAGQKIDLRRCASAVTAFEGKMPTTMKPGFKAELCSDSPRCTRPDKAGVRIDPQHVWFGMRKSSVKFPVPARFSPVTGVMKIRLASQSVTTVSLTTRSYSQSEVLTGAIFPKCR